MISKGKINTNRLILLIIVLLMFIGGFYGLYKLSFDKEFIQLDILTILVIFSGILVYSIRFGLNELKTVDIFNDRIRIKYFEIFSRTILFSEIISYNTFLVEKNQYLQIRTSKSSLLINRTLLSNSKELIDKFNEFSHKRDQHYNLDNYRNRKNKETILLRLSGYLLVTMGLVSFFLPNNSINRDHLVSIKSNLKGNFEIQKPRLRNPGHYITFNTITFQEFTFIIGSPGYNSSDLQKLEKYIAQDTVEMLIKKSDVDVKLLKSQNPSFFEKHFNWNKINVYELSVNNTPIYTLDEFNSEIISLSKTDHFWALAIGLIGIEIIRRGKKAYK